MIMLREIKADDWELLRDVRLAALAEAPRAFGSTHAREVAFTEEQWRGRISERSATFFAHQDSADPAVQAGPPAGLVGVLVTGGGAELVSMWVSPPVRGLGVGDALVETAATWAKAHDFRTLSLWVTESNKPALRLYERCGFTATGERQPLPSDPTLTEVRMDRIL
ncbi:MAG: GNAT family N-acetyltransferase [Trebonia sp.]